MYQIQDCLGKSLVSDGPSYSDVNYVTDKCLSLLTSGSLIGHDGVAKGFTASLMARPLRKCSRMLKNRRVDKENCC